MLGARRLMRSAQMRWRSTRVQPRKKYRYKTLQGLKYRIRWDPNDECFYRRQINAAVHRSERRPNRKRQWNLLHKIDSKTINKKYMKYFSGKKYVLAEHRLVRPFKSKQTPEVRELAQFLGMDPMDPVARNYIPSVKEQARLKLGMVRRGVWNPEWDKMRADKLREQGRKDLSPEVLEKLVGVEMLVD
ncbi:MAG: hypothetical protein MHM6MM_005559 [Cercozoa sp. M6MM]